MITWLQTSFGKHHKIIFGLLLGVIILTFVLSFGPSGMAMLRQDSAIQKKLFYGFNLTSQKEIQQLQIGARLSAAINPKDARIMRQNFDDYVFTRTAGLGLANEYGVPVPTNEQLKEYIQSRSAFQNEKGEYDASLLSKFVDSINASGGQYTEDSLTRTLIEDWRVDAIAQTISGPGVVLPFEARLRLSEKQSTWSVTQATTDYKSFQPEITIDDATAQAFYDSNPARYEEPEKVKVSTLDFPFTSYLPQVADPDEAVLRSYFDANKARFQKQSPPPAEGEPPAPPTETTFEEVHDDVVKTYKENEARKLAETAADAFSVKLFREGITHNSKEFTKLVQTDGLTLTDFPAYSKNQPPYQIISDMQSYRQLLNAFDLDQENYHSDPLRTRTGAALIIWEAKVTSYIPGFDEVKDRVIADAKQDERRKEFIVNGSKIKASIELEMSTGKSFEEAAKTAGLTTKVFDTFTGDKVPQDLQQNGGFQQLLGLDQGKVSNMVSKGDDGIFIYLSSKTVPSIDKNAPEVVAEIADLNKELKVADGWMLLGELASKEIQRLNPPKELMRN